MRPERIAWKGASALANETVRRPNFATVLCNVLYWEMGSDCPSCCNLQHGLFPHAKSSVVWPWPRDCLWGGGQCQGATNQGGKEQCKICSLFSLTSNPVFLPERVLAASCSWKAFAICPDCSGSYSCTYRVTGVVRCPSQSPCVSFLCSCGVWLPFSTTSAL